MGIQKFTTLVQVLICFPFKENKVVNIEDVLEETKELSTKLFPTVNRASGPRGGVFKSLKYQETHQITWDISGDFVPTTDQIMEAESHNEMLMEHFSEVLVEHFGKYDAEYKVYECGNPEPLLECVWGK